MVRNASNRPAEIFGYPIENRLAQAEEARKRHWCRFVDAPCNKTSRLIDYPFGVCSADHHGEICAVCPRRFEEPGTFADTPRVLSDIALHYFGDYNNVILFPEVGLPNVGTIDYILVRHRPLKPEVEDFVAVEFQTDSTTGTGALVQGLRDFVAGYDVRERSYRFGMNTYDTIKRSVTQLLNKGIVYEAWTIKGFWVVEEYIYTNLVNRYGLKQGGYVPDHASRFALYKFSHQQDLFTLTPTRYVSTTVDEVYQAMRNNPGLPSKDRFVETLNARLQIKLNLASR
jgi:hypothetical protein